MIKVKFDKAVKYNDVRYDAHEVFEADNQDMEALVKAGATVLEVVQPPAPPTNPPQEEEGKEEKAENVAELKEKLLDYTVAELTKFAQERGIDLQDKTRKADIYNLIVANLK